MIIAVDFDGTIVENKYPEIGDPIPGAIGILQAWKARGHTIIINSCRSGVHQAQMEAWLIRNHVAHDYINENDPARTEQYGSDCRKISADIYIDDHDVSMIHPSGDFMHIGPLFWHMWDNLVRRREKFLMSEAQKSENVIMEDLDIVLGHNPLKSP